MLLSMVNGYHYVLIASTEFLNKCVIFWVQDMLMTCKKIINYGEKCQEN